MGDIPSCSSLCPHLILRFHTPPFGWALAVLLLSKAAASSPFPKPSSPSASHACWGGPCSCTCLSHGPRPSMATACLLQRVWETLQCSLPLFTLHHCPPTLCSHPLRMVCFLYGSSSLSGFLGWHLQPVCSRDCSYLSFLTLLWLWIMEERICDCGGWGGGV